MNDSTSENESSTSRISCSYVQITSDVMRIGRIIRLMQHWFGGNSYDLAIMQEYRDKHVDTDSQLLYTDPNKCSRVIVPLSSLSPPLHVAIEHQRKKLWFLKASLDMWICFWLLCGQTLSWHCYICLYNCAAIHFVIEWEISSFYSCSICVATVHLRSVIHWTLSQLIHNNYWSAWGMSVYVPLDMERYTVKNLVGLFHRSWWAPLVPASAPNGVGMFHSLIWVVVTRSVWLGWSHYFRLAFTTLHKAPSHQATPLV